MRSLRVSTVPAPVLMTALACHEIAAFCLLGRGLALGTFLDHSLLDQLLHLVVVVPVLRLPLLIPLTGLSIMKALVEGKGLVI